jgi:phenylacetic acid degradation operon negative regulatory protein
VPAARTLALGFLSTSAGAPMRIRALVRRAGIVGVDAAAMRMALARLVREGRVRQIERGVYTIGAAGAALHRLARGWAAADRRVRAWDGGWLVVAIDHLGRTDKRRLRQREQALRLQGLARTDWGAWVRPDNIAAPLAEFAARLHALGLDAEATILGGAQAANAGDAAWRGLWPVSAIETGYRHWIAEVAASEARVAALSVEAAARETLLLGQAVIRAINRDPLLPAELIDTGLRAAMIAAMRRYDTIGKACWAAVD